jgi:hypothetical protein
MIVENGKYKANTRHQTLQKKKNIVGREAEGRARCETIERCLWHFSPVTT